MPSKRQRLFALLIRDEIESRFYTTPDHGPYSSYIGFIRAQANAKPTSTGYPYHLALRQIEGR